MTRDQVCELIQRELPARLRERPGAVMYCGTDALRPGLFYLMGLNPGGHPEKVSRPIIPSIPHRVSFSEYTHECWLCDQGKYPCEHIADGRVLASAMEKHQRNVIRIAEALGRVPETLFSANAIFGRSTSLATLETQTGDSLATWWEACWRVHARFLAIVRPRVVISLGKGLRGSAFSLLRGQLGGAAIREIGESGPRGGREFLTELALPDGDVLPLRVIGVPHPSWYEIGPRLAEELQRAAQGA